VALRWLAAVTCGGMLLVLVMGAAVTNTGSAEGCGRSWPLCNGQFVPEFTVATAIEYSHRAVTGVETLLVLGLSAAMLLLWRREREVVVLVVLMLGTLFLQAGLGAGAVLFPQSPLMLATHFGVSLVAFASTFLSAAVVWERTGSPRQPIAVPRKLRNAVLLITLYLLGVVYLGAYIRHAGVSLACTDWPLCNGQLIPPLDGPTGIVFAHRLAALGAVGLLCWLAVSARRAQIGATAATWAAGLGVLQALSGALVVWTLLGLFSTLLHAALIGMLFAMLAYVLRLALAGADRNNCVPNVRRLSENAARNLRQPEGVSGPHALATPSPGLSGASGHSRAAEDRAGQRPVAGPAARGAIDAEDR
jgi:heme a synthase